MSEKSEKSEQKGASRNGEDREEDRVATGMIDHALLAWRTSFVLRFGLLLAWSTQPLSNLRDLKGGKKFLAGPLVSSVQNWRLKMSMGAVRENQRPS